jgi:hypothetical protein
MQEEVLLKKLKNKNNYKKPNTAVVIGILYGHEQSTSILKELNDMLQDNFFKTKSILGEEMTNLVLSETQKFQGL